MIIALVVHWELEAIATVAEGTRSLFIYSQTSVNEWHICAGDFKCDIG